MVKLAFRLLQRVPSYWRRYTDRCINSRSKPARYVALRGWVGEDRRHWWVYTHEHPSTQGNQMVNHKQDRVLEKEFMEDLIEPIKEWTVHLGDRVEILVGRDKGKQGLVNKIVHQRNWVFVEGLNKQYTTQENENLKQFVGLDMPLDVSSEIALVDPVTEKAAEKVEWRYTKEGEKVRVILPSGAILKPSLASEVLPDGVNPNTYIDNSKTDTTEAQLKTPTYKANLKTFEQDIMDSMGIVEERTRGKTYWY